VEIVLIINWVVTAIIAIFLLRDNKKAYEDLEDALETIIDLGKENIGLIASQNSVLEYLDNSNISRVDKDEIAIRLRGDKNETSKIDS